MKTELYNTLKALNIEKLSETDLQDLLSIFMVISNPLIRNYLAIVFADVHYEKAIPYLLKKIGEKDTYNNNSTLVHALGSFDMSNYLVQLAVIVCEQEYEARLMAYGIIEEIIPKAPNEDRKEAIQILKESESKLTAMKIGNGENGTLHFIENTKKLIEAYLQK
jgi:hypothetical protein